MPETVLFDRYRLLDPAGSGGSAEVWRARDERTGDEVAVKRLHPVVFADEAGRRRLRREFAALRTLDEPHIVRVRDLVVGEREAALVLDYVPGVSLAQRLAEIRDGGEPLSPETAVAIAGDVAAALSAAHAAGIVHRDVTPGNILLTPDGEARLTDFGIAHASTDTTAVTATGLLMGTMRYLAPEQLRGEVSTPASDLHALAAVTYEMLAGRPAYGAASPVALVDEQRDGPPPIAGIPAALDAAVRRGLAVEPERRPRDAQAFAASLTAALADEPTAAIPVPVTSAIARALPRAHPADAGDVGVASPSRAAATHGPWAVAAPSADGAGVGGRRAVDRGRGHRDRRDGAIVPAPVAVAIGLVLAAALLVAAAGGNGPAPSGPKASASAAVAVDLSGSPTPTASPTPTPSPSPVVVQAGGGKGKGHDKGKGKGNGG